MVIFSVFTALKSYYFESPFILRGEIANLPEIMNRLCMLQSDTLFMGTNCTMLRFCSGYKRQTLFHILLLWCFMRVILIFHPYPYPFALKLFTCSKIMFCLVEKTCRTCNGACCTLNHPYNNIFKKSWQAFKILINPMAQQPFKGQDLPIQWRVVSMLSLSSRCWLFRLVLLLQISSLPIFSRFS